MRNPIAALIEGRPTHLGRSSLRTRRRRTRPGTADIIWRTSRAQQLAHPAQAHPRRFSVIDVCDDREVADVAAMEGRDEKEFAWTIRRR